MREDNQYARRSAAGIAVALLLALPSWSAASGGTKGKPRKVVGGEVEKVGEILIVSGLRGGEPQLTDEQKRRFLLTGKWRGELLRLGGHRTKVWGQLGEKKLMQPTIEVSHYELLDAGSGRKPHVGLLLRGEREEQLLLRSEETVLNVTAQPALRRLLVRRLGCKVWIVGQLESSTLKASKFGWLSCNRNKSIKPKKETPR